MLDSFEKTFLWISVFVGIGLILGLWKTVEIIIWVFSHIKIVWG